MAPLVGRVFARRRQRKQLQKQSCIESVPAFLRPFGYVALDSQRWQSTEKEGELSIRITNHAEVERHTQYHVECSITWPAEDGTHLVHMWGAECRLKHFRTGIHDPVKKELAGSYAQLFHRARFAQRGGPKGTTAKLNRWLRRLAQCVSSRTVPPKVVALVLSALDVPTAPGGEPCITEVVQADSIRTAVDPSEEDERESCSDVWSELGLSDASDADSLDAAAESEETGSSNSRAAAGTPLSKGFEDQGLPVVTWGAVAATLPEEVKGANPVGGKDLTPEACLTAPDGKGAGTVSTASSADADVVDDISCDDEETCNGTEPASLQGPHFSDGSGVLWPSSKTAAVPDLQQLLQPAVSLSDLENARKNRKCSDRGEGKHERSVTDLLHAGTEADPDQDESRVQARPERSSACLARNEPNLKVQLRHVNKRDPNVGEDEPKFQVQLRPVNERDPNVGEDEPKFQVQLRPVSTDEHACVKSESKFQEKLRLRREAVEWQKISGRGMLDF